MKTAKPLTLIALALLLAACQAGTETKKTEPAKPAATPANTAGKPADTPKAEADKPAGFSLATPADTYKTAYAARAKKDIATLKRVFSKEVLEFLEEVSKEEKKTLDDTLKELTEKPQNPSNEVRNEKINGDKATLEYLNEQGKWTVLDFVKEGNDWKMTVPGGPPDAKDK